MGGSAHLPRVILHKDESWWGADTALLQALLHP